MICIPIMDATGREALRTVERSARSADAIELRMDLIADGDLTQLMAAARAPSDRLKIIVTCRRKEESLLPPSTEQVIRKELTKTAKMQLLKQAIKLGADFIDIELACGERAIKQLQSFCRRQKSPTRVIVSWHDISKTPSLKTLKEIFQACAKAGADMVKIVPYARKMSDNLKVLRLIDYAKAQHHDIIAMCMGDEGKISRVMAPLWGSYLGFAVLPGGKESAPGQLTLNVMREFQSLQKQKKYRAQQRFLPSGAINFVLLGNPVLHSL